MSGMRVFATLYRPVESETPYGGRAVTYEPMGAVWLRLGGRRRSERTEAGLTRGVETARGEVRADPRLAEGLTLRFGGADWRIAAVEDGALEGGALEGGVPGRMVLALERDR